MHDGLAHIATESDAESCSNNDELMEDKDGAPERLERLSVLESMLPRDLERIQVSLSSIEEEGVSWGCYIEISNFSPQALILDLLPPKTMFNRDIRQSLLSGNGNFSF